MANANRNDIYIGNVNINIHIDMHLSFLVSFQPVRYRLQKKNERCILFAIHKCDITCLVSNI